MRGQIGIALLGLCLLAVSLPLGLTLEALHAMKVQVYLGSALRRELWTLESPKFDALPNPLLEELLGVQEQRTGDGVCWRSEQSRDHSRVVL